MLSFFLSVDLVSTLTSNFVEEQGDQDFNPQKKINPRNTDRVSRSRINQVTNPETLSGFLNQRRINGVAKQPQIHWFSQNMVSCR